jgi:hypothetical protein
MRGIVAVAEHLSGVCPRDVVSFLIARPTKYLGVPTNSRHLGAEVGAYRRHFEVVISDDGDVRFGDVVNDFSAVSTERADPEFIPSTAFKKKSDESH